MIDWLIQQTWVTSFIILLLIMIKRMGINHLGASGYYRLWALLPASLLLTALPTWDNIRGDAVSYVVSVKQQSVQLGQHLFDVSPLLVNVWLCVAALLVVVYSLAHYRYLQSLKECAIWPPSITRLQPDMHFAALYTCETVTSPCITGWFNSRLIIPTDFEQRFSIEQQHLILLHESVHKKRGDLFFNLLAQLLLCLFWFNPLAWVGYSQFRQAQELACDQVVLKGADKEVRVTYAKAMLRCAQPLPITRYSLAHYSHKAGFKERVAQLQYVDSGKAWTWWLIGISAFIALSLFHLVSTSNQGQIDTAVRAISRVEPVYPKEAAEKGIEGSIVLKFDIDIDGKVEDVAVVSSAPEHVFDKAAINAIQQWRYSKPASRLRGMKVQLDFLLEAETDNLHSTL